MLNDLQAIKGRLSIPEVPQYLGLPGTDMEQQITDPIKQPSARTYQLYRSNYQQGQRSRFKAGCKPPTPKEGERGCRPYSIKDRDAVLATSSSRDWQALVTLTLPVDASLLTWFALRDQLVTLKQWLTNAFRRKGFPAMIFVTEFDSVHFHIGFTRTLNKVQQEALRDYWLNLKNAANNQGGLFNYRACGGGPKLQAYIGKDMKGRLLQKYRPEWIPERTECRLWFCIGLKHRPAKEGAAIRASKKIRRSTKHSFRSATECEAQSLKTAKIAPTDSAHAIAYSTAVRHARSRRIGRRSRLPEDRINLSACMTCRHHSSFAATTGFSARAPPDSKGQLATL
jgi:hypothetical protein